MPSHSEEVFLRDLSFPGLPTLQGFPGSKLIDVFAIAEGGSAGPANESELESFAQKWAYDFYDHLMQEWLYARYAGVLDDAQDNLNGFIDEIVVEQQGEQMFTELKRPAWDNETFRESWVASSRGSKKPVGGPGGGGPGGGGDPSEQCPTQTSWEVDLRCEDEIPYNPCDQTTGTGTGTGTGTFVDTECCEELIPTTLTATISDAGECACADDADPFTLTYNVMTGKWEGEGSICTGEDFTFKIWCNESAEWKYCIEWGSGCGTPVECDAGGVGFTPASCDPFSATIGTLDANTCCGGEGGNITIVVTE